MRVEERASVQVLQSRLGSQDFRPFAVSGFSFIVLTRVSHYVKLTKPDVDAGIATFMNETGQD